MKDIVEILKNFLEVFIVVKASNKYKIISIEMKRYLENFIVVKTINKYKIISIEMKRYLENFYSLFMHYG